MDPIWEILAGIAGLWVFGALAAAVPSFNFLSRSQPVPGFVVGIEPCTNDSWRPVVEFLHRGAVYRTRGRVGTNRSSIRVGAPIVVRLRDGRPDDARIGSFFHLFALPIALTIVALVFGAMAGCVAGFDTYG